MYRIYADDVLIYDSTLEDYKIGKGEITLEVDKSGSFVFSVYPDHPFYNSFVKLKTVITVYKSGRIVFRGRVLNDVTDYWNNKTLTCEGELGFLRDSVIRPFEFTGTPAALFEKFIREHNAQVDEFKRFKVGTVTVQDGNDYINRSTAEYPTTQDVLLSALPNSELGGHFYVTHGDDGADPVPTVHYVADFPKTASQAIEFGVNLKDYTKTVKAEDVATAIIPLGTEVGSNGQRLTIASINGGVDYVYDAAAVALYGWVFKTMLWEDVTLANHLKAKAEAYLAGVVNQPVTIELTAVDLHMLDRSIESYNVCEYVRATSKPHGFDAPMLCSRQTMNLLRPDSDTVTLGYQTKTFTGASTQMAASVSTLGKKVSTIAQNADSIGLKVENLTTGMSHTLRVAEDGVTITDANGNAVMISGGCVDAKTIKTEDLVLTGIISFSDLDAAAQNTINNKPDASTVTQITSNAIRTASISANQITAGTFNGGSLDLSGLMRLVDDFGNVYGCVGAGAGNASGVATTGVVLRNIYDNAGFIATDGGARMYCGDNAIYCVPTGCFSTSEMKVSSDVRLKNSISYDLSKEEKMFATLKPCSFSYNRDESGKKHWGFIAQELLESVEAAGLTADSLDVVGKDGGDMYALAYGEITSLNTHMIQKLMARVEALENEKKKETEIDG